MSMLTDDSREFLEKAATSILKINDGAILRDGSVRKFAVPALNYEAYHYSHIAEIINLSLQRILHLTKSFYIKKEK